MKEEEVSTSSFFVTLTYDTDHVPITRNGYMTLKKRDVQLFFKRLRKAHGKQEKKLRYYVAGEYGSNRSRPHYHIILFNSQLERLIGTRYAAQVAAGNLQLEGSFPFYCPSWEKGSLTVGRVSEASVGYCLKYLMKEGKIPMHKNDDRTPEFQLQSKGLGANYLTDDMRRWHESDLLNRMYVPLKSSGKIAMPRYYKQKLYTEQDRMAIGEHMSRIIAALPEGEVSIFPQNSKKRYQRLNSTL